MKIVNITDYDNMTTNEIDIDIIIQALKLSIPGGILFLCLMSLIVYTLIKPLLEKDKILYPNHPCRVIITGPSNVGKTYFLTNIILNIINEYDKIYIFSPSIHQELYQRLIKCFSNYIPINIIPNILNEEDIDLLIVELVYNKDFEKSDIEIESFDNIQEMKFPQDYEKNSIIILDDLNQKEMDDPRVQAMFKRSRHNNLSIFIISQDYYELSKKTIRANGNIFHIFKPSIFLDVRNLYQDKASMDMTLNEFKLLTSICWNEKYHPLTIDMTEDKYQCRYRLGLNNIFVPDTSPY